MTNKIHLVQIIPLKRLVNERGYLLEVQRNDDDHHPGFGQAYITATNPGVIKAWYRHNSQTDQISLIRGSILLVLYDERRGSPTYGNLQEILLGKTNPLLVQIPPGVWHGFIALTNEQALVLHLNSAPWSLTTPDEDRLPSNDPNIPFSWPD
jgi:dTDP-4-dehydrorhamnose 3,5-epimerase